MRVVVVVIARSPRSTMSRASRNMAVEFPPPPTTATMSSPVRPSASASFTGPEYPGGSENPTAVCAVGCGVMDSTWSKLIAAVQGSGRQAVLAITGGGTGAIAELLRVPGGSRILLEAIVPYDAGSLRDFLGGDPEQACSDETAVAMAERARRRAATLAKPDVMPI